MDKEIMLTEHQAAALYAFIKCLDEYAHGTWLSIEQGMRETHGVENPSRELMDAVSKIAPR